MNLVTRTLVSRRFGSLGGYKIAKGLMEPAATLWTKQEEEESLRGAIGSARRGETLAGYKSLEERARA